MQILAIRSGWMYVKQTSLFWYSESQWGPLLCHFMFHSRKRFGTTWEWVNFDKIFIFRWTISFIKHTEFLHIIYKTTDGGPTSPDDAEHTSKTLWRSDIYVVCHSFKIHAQTAVPVVNVPLVSRRVKFTSTTISYQLASSTLTQGRRYGFWALQTAYWLRSPSVESRYGVPLSDQGPWNRPVTVPLHSPLSSDTNT